jgi:hypothetical protein
MSTRRSPTAPTASARRIRGPGLLLATALALGSCGGGSDGPAPPITVSCPSSAAATVDGPAWGGFARDAQHSALMAAGGPATQDLSCIYWQTAVDLAPQFNASGSLLTHYGSPVITRRNTVVVPVKTGAAGGFRVDARNGHDGTLKWTLASDYVLPAHRWVPSFNPVLAAPATAGGAPRLVMPGSGGRLLVRADPDADTGATSSLVFYGASAYAASPASYDATVFINTPLTADSRGNVYFGFQVTGANPANLAGGFARVAPDGTASLVSAATASGDAALVKPQTNSAPALSADETRLYVMVNNIAPAGTRARGSLLALDATTLAPLAQRPLLDPATGTAAWVSDDSTASPAVGPDGDVFVGVLESATGNHHFRGWMLHFDATLAQTRTTGSFGWDNTPSIVPRTMVPQYTGPSSYLLLTKYNDYGGAGGDGRNRVAILDPGQSQPDPINANVQVMREVLLQLGPTPDPEYPPVGVKEWCINTAAVDPATNSVLINSEDGYLYRWHLPSNSFTQRIVLNPGVAQSYTPTAIGPDGRVYALNNATLHAIGKP